MAYSKWPKCEHSIFELEELVPLKSDFKLNAVQCAQCGTVVGVIDYYNVPSMLIKMAKKMGFELIN